MARSRGRPPGASIASRVATLTRQARRDGIRYDEEFAERERQAQHDEGSARIAAMNDGAARHALMASKRGEVLEPDTGAQLVRFVVTFSKLTGRALTIERKDRERRVVIVQRCRACKDEIETTVPVNQDRSVDIAKLGHRIRFDYDDNHQCKPIETSLHGCSIEELDAMEQSLEADSVRLAERANAVRHELARRRDGA